MFYSIVVLGKKGPLARVWLAAHWDKKITKSQILETNIVASVDSVLEPKIKLSLRTSSHLLLGIVRIYARKTIYLLQDCQDAAFKIKSAFRPGAVDLPEGKQEAAVNAITLPEMLDFVTNFDLIEPPALTEPVINTTNHRSITLAEDVAMTDDTFLSGFHQSWTNNAETSAVRNASNVSGAKALQQLDANLNDDGFGGELGLAPLPDDEFFQVDIDVDAAPKGDDLIGTQTQERPVSRASHASDVSGANSMADSGPPSTPGGDGMAFGNDDIDNIQGPFDSMRDMDAGDENAPPTNGDSLSTNGNLPPIQEESQENGEQPLPDSMVLDPVVQDNQGLIPRRKKRRRLGIIVDDVKTLSGEEIKAQLSDTKDIVTALDLAPPTKQLMEVRRSANVDKLFSQPECQILSKILIEHYTRNLISSKLDHEAADGELPSMARHDSYNSFNGHQMDSFVAPSFGYDGDMSGQPQDVSYLDNQPDYGGDLLPPRTPKTPASYRNQQTPQSQRSSPKKKKARTENSNEELIDKQRSTSKKSHSDNNMISSDDLDLNNTYDNTINNNDRNFITNDEDDGPVEDPINAGETEEQYEERIRNRRTHILLQLLGPRLDEGTIQFSNLCQNYRRKQVAQHFFSLLVLKKQQAVDLVQAEGSNCYGELYVSKGPRYANLVPSN